MLIESAMFGLYIDGLCIVKKDVGSGGWLRFVICVESLPQLYIEMF